MPRLVIACARPGLIRGGVRHPKVAEHLIGAFSPDQLRELLAEPEIAVVVGRPLTLDDVATLEAGKPLTVHEAGPAAKGKK
nr:hypothetical protein [uncultured Rhodopila sp.]